MKAPEQPATQLRRAKFQRPRLGRGAIDRTRLHALLDDPSRDVVAISAPAGFGKTTLAATWTAAQPVPVAWFQFDPADNDVATIVRGIAQALGTAGIDLDRTLLTFAAKPGVPAEQVGRMLAAGIEAAGQPVVIVLDDLHMVDDDRIRPLLSGLLEFPIAGVRYLLGSRSTLPIAMSRLVGSGRGLLLDASAMAFDLDESRVLLAGIAPDAIAEAAQLHDLAAGWPAAMSLGALHLAAGRSSRALEGVGQSLAPIVEETLGAQPPAVRALLMRLALADVVSADLADTLGGTGDPSLSSARFLDRLVASNMLVQGYGEGRSAYRFHPLFRDYLARRFRDLEGQAAVRDASREIANWFAAQGRVEEAIRAWLIAGEPAQAVELAVREAYPAMGNDRWRRVERWLRILGPALVDADLNLVTVAGWIAAIRGMLAPFVNYTNHAADQLADPARVEDRPDLAGLAARTLLFQRDVVVRLTPRLAPGEPDGTLDALSHPSLISAADLDQFDAVGRELLAEMPADFHYGRTVVLIHLSLALTAGGRYDQAVALCRDQFQRAGLVPNPSTARALLAEGSAHLYEGRYPEVIATAQRLRDLAIELDLPLCAHWACCFLSVASFRRGEMAAARRWTIEAGRWSEYANWNADRLVHNVSALIALAGEAESELDEAISRIRERGIVYGGLSYILNADLVRARAAILHGDRTPVEAWVREGGDYALDNAFMFFDIPAVTRARALVFLGGEANLAEAEAILSRVAGTTDGAALVPLRVELLTLAAMLRAGQGRTPEAIAALRDALTLAEPGGDRWPFIEALPRIRDLLTAIAVNSPDWSFPRDLLQEGETRLGGRVSRQLAAAAAAGISPREAEVLALLQGPGSFRDIARDLFIAEATAKRHAATIYTKLGVSSRRDAVLRAIELGILGDPAPAPTR